MESIAWNIEVRYAYLIKTMWMTFFYAPFLPLGKYLVILHNLLFIIYKLYSLLKNLLFYDNNYKLKK
jgi:hypothetical protein